MNRTLLLTVPVLAVSLASSAVAQMFGPDYKPCGNQPNTLAIVDCVAAKTKISDRQLNADYKKLMQYVDAGQREPLKAAQRLWIQYRDANCLFYGSAEGSIRQIKAAECLRSMTQDRAHELEEAMRP